MALPPLGNVGCSPPTTPYELFANINIKDLPNIFDNNAFFRYTLHMGKIDEVKEILNTLRVAMSLIFGFIVILAGSLVKRYDLNHIDYIFWIGIILVFVLMGALALVVKKISKKTKEIKDL